MFLFLKSLSRSVHEEQQEEQSSFRFEKRDNNGKIMSFTVWRKSLIMSCKGFTVIDSNGNIIYRVDNYIGRPDELTLMDCNGKSLITLHRRNKVVERWKVYEGEERKAICSVRKQVRILKTSRSVLAEVWFGRRFGYSVEGSYVSRSCKVVDEKRRVLAEVKRKESERSGVDFGSEVFLLVVHGGFDPGFAMALVVLLDQMFS